MYKTPPNTATFVLQQLSWATVPFVERMIVS